ncbi:GDSL esterase/lipase At5g45920-like [Triticum urartu]|uniref:SGNH hydrolase-type esterase domain-containing protein n=1 Tax=Triticum urartu TaxID=4572 RepID=A0A8R7QZX2_TRIUA|nr:GDSL esterase/lipase At5g45920-like [Triticum urartu]
MRPSIVLFGDSITEESFGEGGWGAHLANHYSRSADVVLRGYSGYNTRWASLVADRAFSAIPASAAVAAVTVFFGANDASLPDRASAFQHVPLPEYRDNLRAICALLRARWPSAALILVTPPPVDERGRVRFPRNGDASGLPERTNEAAGRYARACVEVARQCGLRAIDLWSRMQEFPGWETAFLRDGLHLTPTGNRLLFEEVVFALRDANLSLEALPADLPLCSDIDPDNAVRCFEEE